jgi:glutamine synthetase
MTRIEYRPSDSTANPYLCLTTMLLAGIDGIVNKTDPVKEHFGPFDKNVSDESLKDSIAFLPRNLEEAIDALEEDNGFLKLGGIITDELLEQWIALKKQEINSINTMPHPFEYKMYFTL